MRKHDSFIHTYKLDGELEVPRCQAERRALQIGLEDGHHANTGSVLRSDEDAAAGHRVDAPSDPAAGALRRPEREVDRPVRRVVRPGQAGTEHRQGGAPLELNCWTAAGADLLELVRT